MAISDQRLAELRSLTSTPREVTTGEHAAVQSVLASAVPELLDEISRLRGDVPGGGPDGLGLPWDHRTDPEPDNYRTT
jgi:hypothetical protein